MKSALKITEADLYILVELHEASQMVLWCCYLQGQDSANK